MLNICLLLVQKWSSNLVDEVEESLSFDGAVELRVVIFQGSPVLLSDDVAAAGGEGLVNKETSFIKASFKPTDHSLAWVSHFKMDLLIDFITNIVEPVLNKDDLVDVIQFREEESCFVVVHWLKILKNVNHELLVLEIGPGVITVSVWVLIIWNAKVTSELLKETFE